MHGVDRNALTCNKYFLPKRGHRSSDEKMGIIVLPTHIFFVQFWGQPLARRSRYGGNAVPGPTGLPEVGLEKVGLVLEGEGDGTGVEQGLKDGG